MKTIIFNGRAFADKKELELAKRAFDLRKLGIYPKLAAIIIGDNSISEKYINIKKQAADRVGCEVDEYKVSLGNDYKDAETLINFLNSDDSIHGIMIQLPLPEDWEPHKQNLFDLISATKDVDGHKDDSKFLPATVKAVVDILGEAEVKKSDKILVVGSEGEVGSRLIKYLKSENYNVKGCDKDDFNKNYDKDADVIISATGKANLITQDLVKKDVVIVDVGYPFGDVDFENVHKKAKFITPVPGGVGPVTVISLMENLVGAAS